LNPTQEEEAYEQAGPAGYEDFWVQDSPDEVGDRQAIAGALFGLLVWREFAGAAGRVNTLLALMLTLIAAGLVVVAIALRWTP